MLHGMVDINLSLVPWSIIFSPDASVISGRRMKPYPSMLAESPVDGLMRIVIRPLAALNGMDDSALSFSPMRSETFLRQG